MMTCPNCHKPVYLGCGDCIPCRKQQELYPNTILIQDAEDRYLYRCPYCNYDLYKEGWNQASQDQESGQTAPDMQTIEVVGRLLDDFLEDTFRTLLFGRDEEGDEDDTEETWNSGI